MAFHWDRRERVLDRDILRFGTATLLVLLFVSAQPLPQSCFQGGLARIYPLMPVIRTEGRPLAAAFRAQARAVLAAQRRQR